MIVAAEAEHAYGDTHGVLLVRFGGIVNYGDVETKGSMSESVASTAGEPASFGRPRLRLP